MIKVRIAPSPTGPLHIGTARAALFNYAFAKNQKGSFLLRIDDTDKERSQKNFEEDIKEGLLWLGMSWDRCIRQSERTGIYKDQLEKLFREEKIFWCNHTPEELSKEREEQMQKKEAPRHICVFREQRRSEGILRFKNDVSGPVIFHDLIRGDISISPEILGDFSVAKNFDSPLYNFTTVVDDDLEEISHIIRGEDHIPNTPKQILIQEALGFSRPAYTHLPLILGKDRSKLSKRHGATSLMQYKKEGYLPDAMINFLGLLGWHPPESVAPGEVFGIHDLITHFTFGRVQKSGAVFDDQKLKWLNSVYIKKTDLHTLSKLAEAYLKPAWQEEIKTKYEWWERVVGLEQTRLETLQEIGERVDYFFEEPIIKKDILMDTLPDPQRVSMHLSYIAGIISSIEEGDFLDKTFESRVMSYAIQEGKKEVLWPFRVALTGKRASPGLFEVAALLGKEKTLLRVKKAQEIIAF